jgi:hypothetical protein
MAPQVKAAAVQEPTLADFYPLADGAEDESSNAGFLALGDGEDMALLA